MSAFQTASFVGFSFRRPQISHQNTDQGLKCHVIDNVPNIIWHYILGSGKFRSKNPQQIPHFPEDYIKTLSKTGLTPAQFIPSGRRR
jgi:hypothetical protein